MTWQPLPFAGGSYADDSRPWSHQDTVNYIPVLAERAGTRSPMLLRGVPGMRAFAGVGTGPIRGARNVEGRDFVVSGTTLYQLSATGVATSLGTIPGTGLVSMAHNQIDNGNELVIANGSAGYVYNTVTGLLEQITDEAFPGFVQVDYLNQYIIGVEPQRRYWFHSDLVNAKEYSSLDRMAGESSPDRMVGIVATHGQALVLSERSGEFFDNVVTDDAAFQRSQGTAMERGCAGWATIAKIDNSVLFVGNDGIVYRLEGYTPVRISTHAIEQALSRCDLSRAFAVVFEDRGHSVYYLTCPDGRTWGYDIATREWHRRQSYGLDRWRINALWRSGDRWLAGDAFTGTVYELDWDYMLEGCDVLERSRTLPSLHADQNRMFLDALEVVVDTGSEESLKHAAPGITGNLPDGTVGEAVSYQYTITRAYPGQPVTVSLASGTLPAGLTLSTAGLLSGTLTTAATYSWTVRVTDECGQATDLADGAVIRSYLWVMARSGSEAMYLATDPVNGPWTATTRNNGTLGESRVLPTGTDKMFVLGGTTAARGYYGTDFNPTGGLATSTVTLGYFATAESAFAGGIVVVPHSNSSGYSLSTDYGASFTSNGVPLAKLKSRGMARLDSGRWLLSFGNGASDCGVMYTNDAVPTATAAWTAVTFAGVTDGDGSPIACNGTAACVIAGVSGKVYRTTDGLAYSNVFTTVTAPNDRRASIAYENVMLMGYTSAGGYLRSTDGGLTWAERTLPSAAVIEQFARAGSVLIANCTDANYYSLNNGDTWSTLALPFTRGTEAAGAAPVLVTP